MPGRLDELDYWNSHRETFERIKENIHKVAKCRAATEAVVTGGGAVIGLKVGVKVGAISGSWGGPATACAIATVGGVIGGVGGYLIGQELERAQVRKDLINSDTYQTLV